MAPGSPFYIDRFNSNLPVIRGFSLKMQNGLQAQMSYFQVESAKQT